MIIVNPGYPNEEKICNPKSCREFVLLRVRCITKLHISQLVLRNYKVY